MKKKILWCTLLTISTLFLGGIVGYRIGQEEVHELVASAFGDQDTARLLFFIGKCDAAYMSDDPKIGIWALEQLVPELEARLLRPENKHFKAFESKTGLILTHTRLVKLYRKLGDPRDKIHLAKALEYCKKLNTEKPYDEATLLEFVNLADEATRKSQASRFLEDIRQSADGLAQPSK